MSDEATTANPPMFVPVAQAPVTVGRSSAATLRLPHPSISRRHATVTRVDAEFLIEDHDSRFGTFLNGARVRTATARPGDRVQFGSAVAYRVEADGLRLDVASEGIDLVVAGLALSVSQPQSPWQALQELHRDALADGRFGVRPGGRKLLVQGVSFHVRPDAFVGILGPSGAGKSTVLHCLASYLSPGRGRLFFDGRRDAFVETDAYRALLGHVPQDDVVDRPLTVRENLFLAARIRLGGAAASVGIAAAVTEALERVGLSEHVDKPAGVLSGGQRKRLSVAVELLRRPRLLLLDEPTSGLDPASEAHLMEQLRAVARRGTTVICTTHLMDNVRLLDEVVVLGVHEGVGRVAFVGAPDDLLPHFGCRHYADLYEILASGRFVPVEDCPDGEMSGLEPATTGDARPSSQVSMIAPRSAPAPHPSSQRSGVSALTATSASSTSWEQFQVVVRRLLLLALRDRGFLVMLLAQPLLLGMLVALTQYDVAMNRVSKIAFFAVVIAIWLGLNNAARDLVRDRRHYVCDRLAGLRPGAYLGARTAVHAVVGVVQLAILLVVLRVVGDWVLDSGVAAAWHDASRERLALALVLSYFGGVGLGLLISALARTEEAAVAALPLLIMPQLLLSAVAAGVLEEPYSKPRPFCPLVVAAKTRNEPSVPAALVDLIAMGCLSRPASLVAEAPIVAGYGTTIWIGDLCHLSILLLAIWTLVLVTFGRSERRWLRLIGLG